MLLEIITWIYHRSGELTSIRVALLRLEAESRRDGFGLWYATVLERLIIEARCGMDKWLLDSVGVRCEDAKEILGEGRLDIELPLTFTAEAGSEVVETIKSRGWFEVESAIFIQQKRRRLGKETEMVNNTLSYGKRSDMWILERSLPNSQATTNNPSGLRERPNQVVFKAFKYRRIHAKKASDGRLAQALGCQCYNERANKYQDATFASTKFSRW